MSRKHYQRYQETSIVLPVIPDTLATATAAQVNEEVPSPRPADKTDDLGERKGSKWHEFWKGGEE